MVIIAFSRRQRAPFRRRLGFVGHWFKIVGNHILETKVARALRRPSVRHEHYHRPLLTCPEGPAFQAPSWRFFIARALARERFPARPAGPA
ncbi:hypothetical protein D3C81_1949790 [compost metagenome]